ncbi:MAG: hypothetical protein J6K72_07785 [Clostridia bacterium]|nr:hypothetical protein [Clostridia bacterium]
MKKETIEVVLMTVLALILAVCMSALILYAFSTDLTSQGSITRRFFINKKVFFTAVETGNFDAVEKLPFIRSVEPDDREQEILFRCGGKGLGPSTSYYGIVYMENGLTVSDEEPGARFCWLPQGNGYMMLGDGDNVFYREPLEGNFFYFEEHY